MFLYYVALMSYNNFEVNTTLYSFNAYICLHIKKG